MTHSCCGGLQHKLPCILLIPAYSSSPSPSPCLPPHQERERLRSMEQKRGALKILDQLAERERDRAAFEAARRRDGEEMKARIKALKDEEQKVRGG